MLDELKPNQWPSVVILNKLDDMAKEINTLSTVLLGVIGTDSRGMAGDLKDIKKTTECHNKDISRIKITLYVLIALTIGTGGTMVTRLVGG